MILSGGTVPEKVYMSYRAQKVSTLSPESKAHAGEWGTGEDRVFTIINSGRNTAGGGRGVQPATILSTTPIDRTRVLDCTDPRAKLPARGVWCGGEGLGQQEQDSQTGRTGYQHLDFSPWDTVQTPRAIGQAERWVLRRRCWSHCQGEPPGASDFRGGPSRGNPYRCPR